MFYLTFLTLLPSQKGATVLPGDSFEASTRSLGKKPRNRWRLGTAKETETTLSVKFAVVFNFWGVYFLTHVHPQAKKQGHDSSISHSQRLANTLGGEFMTMSGQTWCFAMLVNDGAAVIRMSCLCETHPATSSLHVHMCIFIPLHAALSFRIFQYFPEGQAHKVLSGISACWLISVLQPSRRPRIT